MSTREQDIQAALTRLRTKQQDPISESLLRLRGQDVDERAEEAERKSRGGIVSSLVEGAAVGLLEPLGFLPPVSNFLDAHVGDPEAHVGRKIGYALGFLGGFAVPSTAALKVGSIGVRAVGGGLKGAQAIRAVRTADAFTDLSLKGNLVRGGIAGALLGAGRDAEDAGERVENVLKEAAFFGIGDAVLHPVMRAISGASVGAGTSKNIDKLVDIAEGGVVQDVEGAEILARGLRIIDELLPTEAAIGDATIGARKTALRAGLIDMGLQNLARGETRIIPSLRADGMDLAILLKNIPEIDFKVFERSRGRSLDVADILIAPKGELSDELVATYGKNLNDFGFGFYPGQAVRHKGVDKVVVGVTRGRDKFELFRPGSGGGGGSQKGRSFAPFEEVVMLPQGAQRLGPVSIPNASSEWIKHVREFGEFPEEGFEAAFKKTAERLELDEAQSQDLFDFFAVRSRESLEKLDPALGRVLGAQRKFRPEAHPDGELAELAGQTGYVIGHTVDQKSGRIVTTVKNSETGSVVPFATDGSAIAHVKANPLKLPDITDGLASPIAANHLGLEGVSFQVDHTAAEIGNVKIPFLLSSIGSQLLPRRAWFRMMDDTLLEGGVETGLFATVTRLGEAINRGRVMSEPWLENLQGLRTKGLRDDKLSVIRSMILTPEKEFSAIAKAAKLSDEELEAAKNLKQYMRNLIEDINTNDKFGIDADDFLEQYMPYIVSDPPSGGPGSTGAGWRAKLEESFRARGQTPNPHMMRFAEEMERAGINPGRHEQDPFMVALRWTTTTFTKRHVDDSFNEVRTLIETLPREGIGDLIRRSLEDSIKVSYGGASEAYYVTRVAARGYFENLGIRLESRDFDRMVSTLVSMNYGAFMGFRPALALRNLTQTMVTTLPMIQSPKHMAEGIRLGFSKAGRDEALEALAVPPNAIGAQFEDLIARDATHSQLARMTDDPSLINRAARVVLPTLSKGQELARIGLSGSVKVGSREIPTGLYGRADHLNRVIAFHAQKSKTLEALRKWNFGTADGHGSIGRFNEDAGLTMFGEAITREFHRLLQNEGTDQAVRWLSVNMANETQWIYQQGAGPAMFSQGIGKLFGMFGTWPSWYASHLIRGATRGTARDKAKFWGWTAATTGAFTGATYATGVNFTKWSPLNSLTWTGGPAVDWFADWRDIVGSIQSPTPKGHLALAERGLRDTGNRSLIPAPFDIQKDSGFDIEEPLKMGRDLLYLFTPGAAQVRDVLRAREESTPFKAALRGAGFQPVAGHSWPQTRSR